MNRHAACQGTVAALTSAEATVRLRALPGWAIQEQLLRRSYRCDTFAQSIRLVNRIAELAERLNHHPDVAVLNKRTVQVTLCTHKLGCLTELDFELADLIERGAAGDRTAVHPW